VLSQLLFLSGSSIQGNGFEKGCLVVVKDISLGSTDLGVDPGRAVGTVTQKKSPDEPATTKGAEKTTPGWL
jgi:hypothetical protein